MKWNEWSMRWEHKGSTRESGGEWSVYLQNSKGGERMSEMKNGVENSLIQKLREGVHCFKRTL